MPRHPHPIEAHVPSLRRYARALRGNAADADDLVQDTLERAHARWHLWRTGRALRPWLFAIMHNVFVNQMEAAAGLARIVPLEAAESVAAPGRAELAGAALDVAAALANLTALEREALLLVALEEFTYAEAAKILEVPVGTVLSRLARARERLRALASEDGGGARAAAKGLVTS